MHVIHGSGIGLALIPGTDSLVTLDHSLLNCLPFPTSKDTAKEETRLYVEQILGFQSLLKLSLLCSVFSFSCCSQFTCFVESRSTNMPGFLCRCGEKKRITQTRTKYRMAASVVRPGVDPSLLRTVFVVRSPEGCHVVSCPSLGG